jgi:nitrogen regulatory protein PII
MFMIMFVLNEAGKLDKILESWDEAGIHGVTIIESTGFHRRKIQRSKLHLTFLMEPISVGAENGNYTLFTAVQDETAIQRCLTATEKIVGDLDNPNTGAFMVWPLSQAKGVNKNYQSNEDQL